MKSEARSQNRVTPYSKQASLEPSVALSQRTMAPEAWLFAKQCFSRAQRWDTVPCQQRAVARGQWTSSAIQRSREMGGRWQWSILQTRFTYQVHCLNQKREKKISSCTLGANTSISRMIRKHFVVVDVMLFCNTMRHFSN